MKIKISNLLGGLYLVVLVFCAIFDTCGAKSINKRVKRVSDLRLADLETLIALSKLSGKLFTVPMGRSRGLNIRYIGRKKRSHSKLMEALLTSYLEQDESMEEIEDDFELILNNR